MNNLTAFGELLSHHMQQIDRAGMPKIVEFGTIKKDLSLQVDSLKDAVPKGDYLLNLSLTGLVGDFLCVETNELHSHRLPATLRGIRPDDRVLVLWMHGQPVVLAILASSKEVDFNGR